MSKRFVVTGADGALGSAVTERLRKDGDVVGADVSTVDLRDFDATLRWAQSVGSGVSGVVALAGGFGMAKLGEIDAAHCDKMAELNLRTSMSTLNAYSNTLSHGASVVLVGSQAYTGAAGMSAYAATKAAVVSLAKSAAMEWKPRGIRVNVILPDIIDTPANRASMPDADYDMWQKPSEIAEVIAFLLSDGAAVMSGNAIELGRV